MLTKLIRAGRARAGLSAGRGPRSLQGFLDERMTTHIAGWVRDLSDPAARVRFSAVLRGPDGDREIAHGVADSFSTTLQELGIGDARHAFRIDFPEPLSPADRDRLVVLAEGRDAPLDLAPQMQGFIDERSTDHIAGWMRNRSDPAERPAVDIILREGERETLLGHAVAESFSPVLAQIGVGDGNHGFRILYPTPIAPEQRDNVIVRAAGTSQTLPLAPELRTEFQPLSHIAMDITNNCNLRCPFCVYDYTGVNTTRLMSDAVFDSAIRLLPYVSDGNFWLSCLHEATMHPRLVEFIERIPRQWRQKIMYTTNLARPMPDAYFAQLADAGLHHVNISMESLDPAVYERMRKGARWRIFSANWDKLVAALRTGSAPPRIRYNIMAYRSNLEGIPDLVRMLFAEKLAWQVEVRDTYDEPHIPDDFRRSEYLDSMGWQWLREQLAGYSPDDLLLIAPPPPAEAPPAEAPQAAAPAPPPAPAKTSREEPPLRPTVYPISARMEFDGKLIIYNEWRDAAGQPVHDQLATTNIQRIRDVRKFLTSF